MERSFNMRFKVSRINKGWFRWFAWRPIKLIVPYQGKTKSRNYDIVWLQFVERRCRPRMYGYDYIYEWEYRLCL